MENDNVDENANLIDDREEARIGMTEVDAFDFERALMLMTVQEKCANIGVKATSIGGLASAALNEMNEEAKAIAKRRAEEVAAIEAERMQALAEEKREREEAEAEEAKEAQMLNVHPQSAIAPRSIPSRPAPTPDNGRRI